jgi:hypothetical protein
MEVEKDEFVLLATKGIYPTWDENAARLFCCDCAELAYSRVGLGYNEPDVIKRSISAGRSVALQQDSLSVLAEARSWIEENRGRVQPAVVGVALACIADNDRIFLEAKALAYFTVALERGLLSRTLSDDGRSYDASSGAEARQLVEQICELFHKYSGK